MEFDEEHKVVMETMNEHEARAFIMFLESEEKRHAMDIIDICELIPKVKERFGLNDEG